MNKLDNQFGLPNKKLFSSAFRYVLKPIIYVDGIHNCLSGSFIWFC